MAVYKMDVSERKAKLLQIIKPDISWGSHFGFSIDMDCGLLVVGAYNYGSAMAFRAGRVWVLQYDQTAKEYIMLGNVTAANASAGTNLDKCSYANLTHFAL